MLLEFYFDLELDDFHISVHDVTQDEVAQVLLGPCIEKAAKDGARSVVGPTAEGRLLQVILIREPDRIFVVTAYKPTRSVAKAYRKARNS